MDTVWHFI